MCIRDSPGGHGVTGILVGGESAVKRLPSGLVHVIEHQLAGGRSIQGKHRIEAGQENIVAVSYTHLDVYKRQPLPPGAGR